MPLETFERNGFKAEIYQDEDTPNPRDDGTHGCELAMTHARYTWPNDSGIDFGDFDSWPAIAAELEASHDALIVLPVWAYEHSGVSFQVGERSGMYADRWDSGQAGLAYVTRENWAETQGTEWTGSADQVEQAGKLIAAKVDEYGKWAGGECYGYQVIDPVDGEVVAESGGLIGWDYVTSEARAAADGAVHQVKCTGTLNRLAGEIEHDEVCPVHGQGHGQAVAYAITRAELDAVAGEYGGAPRTLTDSEFERIRQTLPHSTIPDAVSEVVAAVLG